MLIFTIQIYDKAFYKIGVLRRGCVNRRDWEARWNIIWENERWWMCQNWGNSEQGVHVARHIYNIFILYKFNIETKNTIIIYKHWVIWIGNCNSVFTIRVKSTWISYYLSKLICREVVTLWISNSQVKKSHYKVRNW